MVFRSLQYALTKIAQKTERPVNASRDGIFSVTENKTQRKSRPQGRIFAGVPSNVLLLLLVISSALMPSHVAATTSTAVDTKASSITEQPRQFNIPRQRADGALTAFGQQADLTVVYQYDRIKNYHTNQLQGDYKVTHAVAILLANTGLSAEFDAARYLIITDQSKGKRMNTANSSKRKTVLAGLVGLFAAGGMTQAVAQGGEAATGQSAIDEIIVTANKREQSLQDVAMAVSALSGETIEKRGLVGMSDYLSTLPGVSMQDRGASQNSVIIRGLASDPQLEDSTVGIYFGETPVTGLGSSTVGDASGSADIKLVDIDRVEVLRGPQGTLYGSGSMAGTVRVIPAKPNFDRVEAKLGVRFSQTGEQGGNNSMVQGILNVPVLEDTLAVRAVVYEFDNSGFFDNVAASQPNAEPSVAAAIASTGVALDRNEVGGDKYSGVRLTTLWQPIDQLSFTLAYTQQKIDQEGFPEAHNNLPGDFQQIRLRTGAGGSNDGFMENQIDITNLVIEYDIGWGSIMSSSSWVDYDTTSEVDLSFFLASPFYGKTNTVDEVFVEELRLSSRLDGPFQFLVGLYYEDSEFTTDSQTLWSGDVTLDSGLALFDIDRHKATDQKALFGELEYAITETISATLGARYFDYDQNFSESTLLLGTAIIDDSSSKDESGESFKFNLSYKPSDDTLIYGQWSEGFRLGQAQAQPSVLCDADNDGILDDVGFAAPNGIDSDTSESFELGFKKSFRDNRATLNAAIYRINWQGMPVSISLPSCTDLVTLNAGASKAEGVEVELKTQLSDRLRLDISASYGEATFTEDAENLGDKGDNLPGSADFNASFGLEYSFTLSGYEAFARSDYAYVSEYYHNIAETGEASGGYSQLNLKAGVVFKAVELDLFVKNLTNANDFTWVETVLSTAGAQRAYRLRPRTVGLNIAYRF